jgi:hypothetical protein
MERRNMASRISTVFSGERGKEGGFLVKGKFGG